MKPGNILVRPDGSVKITDFGIAWSARSVALTRTGQVIGTPQYLSPEQAEGRPATPASDVYALGLIGYECLTGHPAFEGDNAVTIALKQVRQDPEPLPASLPDRRPRADLPRPAQGPRRPPARRRGLRRGDRRRARRPAAGRGAGHRRRPPGRDRGDAPPRPRRRAALPGARRPEPVRPGAVRSPAGRSRRRVATVLLPLLALLAGAGIAAALLQALSDGPPAATASAAEQQRAAAASSWTPTTTSAARWTRSRPAADGPRPDVELREEVTEDTVPGPGDRRRAHRHVPGPGGHRGRHLRGGPGGERRSSDRGGSRGHGCGGGRRSRRRPDQAPRRPRRPAAGSDRSASPTTPQPATTLPATTVGERVRRRRPPRRPPPRARRRPRPARRPTTTATRARRADAEAGRGRAERVSRAWRRPTARRRGQPRAAVSRKPRSLSAPGSTTSSQKTARPTSPPAPTRQA